MIHPPNSLQKLIFPSFSLLILVNLLTAGCVQEKSTAFNQDPSYSTISEDLSLSSLCEEASTHVQECTGTSMVALASGCDNLDAELLLETPCEVLTAASDVQVDLKADGVSSATFTCLLLGIGCPVDQTCYTPLSEESTQMVIDLSDPNELDKIS